MILRPDPEQTLRRSHDIVVGAATPEAPTVPSNRAVEITEVFVPAIPSPLVCRHFTKRPSATLRLLGDLYYIWWSLLGFHKLICEALAEVVVQVSNQLVFCVIGAGIGSRHSSRGRTTRL